MGNVTDSQLAAYLATFHAEYNETVERYVPPEHRMRLDRYSRLPTSITGYVSTQKGAGFEYGLPGSGISVLRSSRAIEDFFVNAPGWLEREDPFFLISAPGIGFQSLSFDGRFPFRFDGPDGQVMFTDVMFKAGQWRRHVNFAELASNRSEEFWSEAEAVRRAKDEVLQASLYLLSAARGVTLEEYLRTFKQRTVLLLGNFTTGRDRLEAIRASLDRAGYLTVLLDEVPAQASYDIRQKFQAVASVCRFLVFEDSTAAGQIFEMGLAENLQAVRIVLRKQDEQSTFMTLGMAQTSKVIREWVYDDADLDAVLADATGWAESVVDELKMQRPTAWPWLSVDEGS